MAKDENKKVKKENKNELKNFKAELKKVVWPTPKQLANNTVAVVTIVLITAVIVFTLDFAFEKANEYGVEKLKSTVESKRITDNSNASDITVDDESNLTENNSNGEAESNNSATETTEQPSEPAEDTNNAEN